jgi:hypothetical protein
VTVATVAAGSRLRPTGPAPDAGDEVGREDRSSTARIGPGAFVAVTVVGIGLRLWALGRHGLSFDETFTAMAARRSPGDLFDFLRLHDSHPPLDYLLRMPFAATGSNFLVRLPSAVFSSAFLALFAWWMHDRGRVGLFATALVAVSGFELAYGREARMYALMQLVGVVVAIGTDRWLRSRSRGAAVCVGLALLVGVFTHVSALLLAAGVFWVAGLARDRAAWWWRAAVAAPVLAWAALWGSSFVQQASGTPAGWIPYTSVDSFLQAVGQPVSFSAGLAGLVVVAIGAGCAIAARKDRRLAIVGAACFVGPLVLAAGIGTFNHFLLPRTLAFAAWAPLLAVAVLVDAALRRSRPLGVVTGIVVLAIVLPSTVQAYAAPDYGMVDAADTHLSAVVHPGDVVAIRPAWMRSLIEWNLSGERTTAVRAPVPGTFALRVTGRPTGRVWLVEWAGDRVELHGTAECARPWVEGSTRVRCVDAG